MTVETFDEMRDEALGQAGAIADGESHPAVVSFGLSASYGKSSPERDYRAVHDDVTLLENYGLL